MVKNSLVKAIIIVLISFVCGVDLFSLTIKDASIDELTIESDLVIRGTVKSIVCKWENENLKKINTIIQVEVEEYYKGNGESSIEVIQMGGKINDIEDIIIGTPRMNLNEEILFFLVKENNQYKIHSIALGCYKIITNEKLQRVVLNDLNEVHLIATDSNEFVSKKERRKEYFLSDLSEKIISIQKQ